MKIKIPFKILAKPRPRFGKGRAYLPKNYMNQRKAIQAIAQEHVVTKLKGPISFIALFETKGKRVADLEQMTGAIKDALEGICYYNDAQICYSYCTHRRNYESDEVVITISERFGAKEEDFKKINYE
jgi:Holliday junction resolvase RusA-like endonuclease